MLKKSDVDHALSFGDSDALTKIPDGLGRVSPPPQTRYGRHPRIIPAGHTPFLDQLQKLTFAHHRVAEVQPRKLDLSGWEYAELFDKPVIQRTVILEFQRTDGMGNPFDGIRLAVGPIVGGIDAPFIARPVMGGLDDAVHHRIPHVQVSRGHVDLSPERP